MGMGGAVSVECCSQHPLDAPSPPSNPRHAHARTMHTPPSSLSTAYLQVEVERIRCLGLASLHRWRRT